MKLSCIKRSTGKKPQGKLSMWLNIFLEFFWRIKNQIGRHFPPARDNPPLGRRWVGGFGLVIIPEDEDNYDNYDDEDSKNDDKNEHGEGVMNVLTGEVEQEWEWWREEEWSPPAKKHSKHFSHF